MSDELDSVLGAARVVVKRLLTAGAGPLTGVLPDGAGVYAIFASEVREALYVGETSNFRGRLAAHRRGRTEGDQMNKNLSRIPGFEERAERQMLLGRCSVSWASEDDTPLRLAAEGVLVALLRPPLNGRVALSDEVRRAELLRRARISTMK